MRFFYCLFVFLFSPCFLFSQNVIRGPYLQTPNDNSIIIMWRTDSLTDSKVWYGDSPSNLTMSVSSSANVTEHSVMVTGLDPYTKYFYAVGNNTGILAGPGSRFYFHTHPLPGTEQPIRVWALGDFGRGNAGQLDVKNSYMGYTGNVNTDVWLWLGDNAYTNGEDFEYQNYVFGYVPFNDLFTWLPFYPTPGNHDYGEVWVQSTTTGAVYSNIPLEDHVGPYYDIVDVPENAEAGGYASQLEVFYSFDYGNVHFLSLNSEVYDTSNTYDGINQMITWITQDLQQNDKLFTVVYFHQPPYSKGSHNSDDPGELVMKAMREKIIPVLESFDVDLVVCGHSHVYERSYLINGHYGLSSSFDTLTMLKDSSNGNYIQGNPYIKDTDSTNDEGTIYVVCGNGGSSTPAAPLTHPIMAFNDGSAVAYGSFIMDIYKNRLDGKYLTSSGIIMDDFTLLKKNLVVNPVAGYTICEGDSVLVQVSFTGGSDSISFNWGVAMPDTSSIYFSPTSTTTYTITVTDLLTGQAETENFTINVTLLPVPIITENNDSLYVQSGYTYNWYLDGNLISGSTTDNFYVPAASGTYTVEIINGTCSEISTGYSFIIDGMNDIARDGIAIYPNPVSGILHIKGLSPNGSSTIFLKDLTGRKILEFTVTGTNSEINLSSFSKGIYFLECFEGGVRRVWKVVVE
jgi:acid phosphatase type 7